MSKNKNIITGIIVLLVIAAITYVLNNRINYPPTGKKSIQEEIIINKNSSDIQAGSYEVYSEDKIARAETGNVVLFFNASWCPSCRALSSNIESNLKFIPMNLSILKVDYDKEFELKKKYGVTYQHTLVQVDKDGNMIKKWSGGSTLDNLLAKIQ